MNYKNLHILIILFSGSLFAAPLETSNFNKPVKITADGKDINVQVAHSAPFVVDWNSDGKKDLLVGQFGGGKMRIYLNKGSDKSPKFKDFSFFQAGGKTASVPCG